MSSRPANSGMTLTTEYMVSAPIDYTDGGVSFFL